jgi:hypothetical protein
LEGIFGTRSALILGTEGVERPARGWTRSQSHCGFLRRARVQQWGHKFTKTLSRVSQEMETGIT